LRADILPYGQYNRIRTYRVIANVQSMNNDGANKKRCIAAARTERNDSSERDDDVVDDDGDGR